MVDDVDSRYVCCTCFERRVAQSSTVEPIAGNQQLYRNMGLNGLEHVEYTACWNPKLAKNFPTSLLLLLQSPTNCHLDCSFLWTFPRQKNRKLLRENHSRIQNSTKPKHQSSLAHFSPGTDLAVAQGGPATE